MKKIFIIFAMLVLSVGAALPAHALLVDNGDNTLTSTTSGLMWHKNANLSGASMDWAGAFSFVDDVNLGVYDNAGHSDWRLASALSPDGSICNNHTSGVNCTDSEIGGLYFELLNEHGVVAYSAGHPFTNMVTMSWSSTEWDADSAMAQEFIDGGHLDVLKTTTIGAILVRDVTLCVLDCPPPCVTNCNQVPEPSTLLLLGSGLAGLGFMIRRFKA